MEKFYIGIENEYAVSQDAAGDWWVKVSTNEEIGRWCFKTEAEAIAFVNGYELGTGADQLPVLDE